jgi:hypothetical protein
MRKWIWASAVLTVVVACGLYGVVRWADRHPLSAMRYGARLVSVAGLGHARVSAPQSAPEQVEEGPRAIVEELPNAGSQEEVSEPIVVEHSQPLPPEGSEPSVNEPAALPPVAESSSPVMEMPPCPEDIIPEQDPPSLDRIGSVATIGSGSDLREQMRAHELRRGVTLLGDTSIEDLVENERVIGQALRDSPIVPVKGEIPNCEVDPNYHHLYPGCPWMGGCQNIPAFVPALPAETTRRVRPAKSKWLSVLSLMEALGLSGLDPAEEPVAVPEEEPANLTDIIF